MHKILPYKDLITAQHEQSLTLKCYAAPHWRAESFRSTEGQPMTIRRARALNAVLQQCDLPVFPGELLVGVGSVGRFLQAGALPQETIEADAQYLQEHIGSRDFGTHCDHHAPDYAKLLEAGFDGLRAEVDASLPRQDEKGRVFLESMRIALDGASAQLERWSNKLADEARHPAFAELLNYQAAMLARLAHQPASTFHEAVQLVLLFHFMMQLDDRFAMAFGRLDQYLLPYYEADLTAGRITQAEAQSILDHFFVKITIVPEIQNITLGGVQSNDGADATNELSYMILEACRRVGRAGGNCTARIHKNTPRQFLEKCAEVIRTGIGYPAVYNDEIAIPSLVSQGYPLEDARDYCFVGCIELFIPGRQAPWADNRANPLYDLNLALFRGIDSLTGERVGPDTGEPQDFEQFYQAVLQQSRHQLDVSIRHWNEVQQKIEDRAEDYTSPLMSALVADCISRGRDMNDGGARYPANNGYAIMGIGSVADALCAVQKLVFEEKRHSLGELREMLTADFEGYDAQRRNLLNDAPKYGNDIDAVDHLAVRFVNDYAQIFQDYRNPQGGFYWALLAANVQNVSGGRVIGATPDGRLAGTPLSDAASPTFGRDRLGITATMRSIAKVPYSLCVGGNVVNVKVHPSALEGREGLAALASLIRTCFDLGGCQLQFNTTDRKVLMEAMERPEDYANLVVRVSGFSANFTTLEQAVQEDIISRTEHRALA